jgi:glycine/D-amino acid oxidase-like deaminating enzyme
MRHADAVVMGNGTMGLPTAYYPAREGATDVVILERGHFWSNKAYRARVIPRFVRNLGD